MSYGRYPLGVAPQVPTGPGRTELQAAAEFREAIGQLGQAEQLFFGYQTIGGAGTKPQEHRSHLDPTNRELAAHKIREAITNLQDVVRFMELP